MAEISYPFESQNIGSASEPEYDRAITAEDERYFNRLRYVNGVFQPEAGSLQVTASGGLKLSVAPGGANIEGALYYADEAKEFEVQAPDAQYDRIDRIVVRFDTAVDVRSISVYMLQGYPASNPQPETITQEPNYYELVLADVRVRKGSTEITNADITDQRMNSELCGMVVPAIPTPLDLDGIYNQYQAALDQFMDLVESAIDETTAGNLQNQINAKASIDDIYPVGSFYLSYNSTSPATFLGGEWTRISGQFLYAAENEEDIGATGGSKTVTLTSSQMPKHLHAKGTLATASTGSHTHNLRTQKADFGTDGPNYVMVDATSGYYAMKNKTTTSAGSHKHTISGSTAETGGSAAHENMPPYLAVYMWRRIA